MFLNILSSRDTNPQFPVVNFWTFLCFYKKEQKTVAWIKKCSYVTARRNKEHDMQRYKELAKVFSRIENEKEMEKFLIEILTESEIDALVFRWRLMEDLYRGETQRSIAEKHHISLCKITRGSKILKDPKSISLKLLNKLEKEQ